MVDATIHIVLERLAPIIEKKVRDKVNLVLINSSEEATSLAIKLKRIQEVLDDAERRSITDRKVEAWLEKIKDAAYDIDDALDEWESKRVEKVSSFIRSPRLCFKRLVNRRSTALKIKQLNGRLESIAKQINDEFNFLPKIHKATDQDSQVNKRILTTSYFDVKDVSEIKGRDDDKNDIINKLLSMRSRDDNRLQIVSIVGTGGLGKTTLARLVFNDFGVKEYFDKTIWVCVSDPFNAISIANSILKSLTGNFRDEKDLQIVLEGIETFALEKRILLVLDDVWEHDEGKWNQIKNCVGKAATGSRILVTTRNVRVAESMGTAQSLHLRRLSDQECWSLLSEIALVGEGNEDPRKKEIGWKIVKRCNGLPLAAKTLGSLLRTKHSVQEWKNVLESQIWELEKVKVDLFPHLYLSYNELRPAIKRCFLYCAKFPKDTEISVPDLIMKWMAQGFLSSRSQDEMELRGWEYVEDLAVRFLFQDLEKASCGRIYIWKMHDIIHDFAQFLTKNECFVVKSFDDIRKLELISKNTRHLACHYEWRSSSPVSMCNVEKLRSFHCRETLPPHVLRSLKCVRELSLIGCKLEELPPDIGNLIHLRYLNLTNNPLRKLPKSMCYLYHLQTLILCRCSSLSQLPEEIHQLINLRHLASDTVSFPQGLEKLTCLRILTIFRTSRGGSKLGYLKNLKQLENLFIIIDDLNQESDVIEASKAELRNKNGLQRLVLRLEREVSTDVIEALEPSPYLYSLLLDGYVGFKFPRWITTSLHSLKCLSIHSCSSLPPLGTLRSLEELYIHSMDEMECLGHEFLGITFGTVQQLAGGRAIAFPKLKKLEFYDCGQWTQWEDVGEEDEENLLNPTEIMSRLRELRVIYCPKLKALPHRLLRKMRLQELNIYGSSIVIEQYEFREGYEFLTSTGRVTVDSF